VSSPPLVIARSSRYHGIMRTPLVALTVIAAACAASSRSIETAHYRGEPVALLGAARAAVQASYKVSASDEAALRIETTALWYSPDGRLLSDRDGEPSHLPDRSIDLQLIVKLVPQGDDWAVAVEPVMTRYIADRAERVRLTPDDPSAPSWLRGKVDQLYAAVHSALQSYEVASPGGVSPMDPDSSAKQLFPRSAFEHAGPSGASAQPTVQR
jgi:hypothetical protein